MFKFLINYKNFINYIAASNNEDIVNYNKTSTNFNQINIGTINDFYGSEPMPLSNPSYSLNKKFNNYLKTENNLLSGPMNNRVNLLSYDNELLKEEISALNKMLEKEVVSINLFKAKSKMAEEKLRNIVEVDNIDNKDTFDYNKYIILYDLFKNILK